MTAAEIGRFLTVCALASELYCPTYLSGVKLAKDSKLAEEAKHYKVNCDRILREVRERLANKARKRKIESKLQTSTRPKRKGSGG